MPDITFVGGFGQDNFDRAARARKALNCGGYENVDDTLNLTIKGPDGEEHDAHSGYPISDLIADLLSLTTSLQLKPADMIREAWEHHGADIIEQVHLNNDDWDNLLQTPANRERARQVLAQFSIPEEHWDGIFAKTGLDNCPEEDK